MSKPVGFFSRGKGRTRKVIPIHKRRGTRGSTFTVKAKIHGPRYRLKGHYVQRDREGKFREWTDIHRGIDIDAALKAKHQTTTPGYGHLKDLAKEKPEPASKQGPKKTPRPVKPEPKPKKEPEKPEKKHPKPPKIPVGKKREPSGRLTHLEKMHLLAQSKKLNLDPQEIDKTITYEENKKHLQQLARERGHSESEVTSTEAESKHWTSEYQSYLSQLVGELTNAGYTITAPEL